MNIKSLTIYCSSSNNLDSIFYETGKKLTEIIAELNFSIVYGGGQVGLMGIIAKKALKLGVNVTGVIPKFLNTKEIMFEEINNLKIVKNMSERKQLLYELGDAYIALPGGTGTIEEITEIISWKVLGLHNKPILIYNINNYWYHLLHQLKLVNKYNFGNINLQTIFQTIDTPEEFKKELKTWKK